MMRNKNNNSKSLYEGIMNDLRRVFTARVNEEFLDHHCWPQEDPEVAEKLAREAWLQRVREAIESLMAGEYPQNFYLEKETGIYQPSDKKELKTVIRAAINVLGNHCSLNWIDTSLITDMEELFAYTEWDGDISQWDVSNVTTMKRMFMYARFFNGSLAQWDVSSCNNMEAMFYQAMQFNRSLNDWDVSKVTDMSNMFYGSGYNQPLDRWDVSSVRDFSFMFMNTHFNQDISMWDVRNFQKNAQIFASCDCMKRYWPCFDRRYWQEKENEEKNGGDKS